MAATYPYISGHRNIFQAVDHFRNSFPQQVNADTFKQLGIAPNNESYLINVLRFVGLLDAEGNKTDAAKEVFSQHKDETFAKGFGELVKTGYEGLFDLHGEKAWGLDVDSLITFFRTSDDTSALVGKRQANTFRALSGLSGHGETPESRASSKRTGSKKAKATKKKASTKNPPSVKRRENLTTSIEPDVGLTVRIEINLPADGEQETYDSIFKSIRENLLNG